MADFAAFLHDSPTCVIAFATADAGDFPNLQRFEFGGTLSRLGIAHVLMRDSTLNWYNNGVAGIGTVKETADYIRSLKRRYDKVMTAGVSFGAYGALLYGQLAEVHEIVAVSPVTVIGPSAEKEFAPHWHHRIKSDLDLDLKKHFQNGPVPKVHAFVTDGDGAELDMHMTSRLGIKHINVCPGHTHGGLGLHLRDTGRFEELFR